MEIPIDFPVRPLTADERSTTKYVRSCGLCGRSWDDGASTDWTSNYGERCPFEYFHDDDDDGARTVPDTGSYIPFAVMDDGGTLCTRCVVDRSNPVHLNGNADGWRVEGWDHSGNVDTDAVICDHCGRVIVDGADDDG